MKFLNWALLWLLPIFGYITPVLSASQSAPKVEILENGSQYPISGLESFFTGKVRVDPLFSAQGEERASGALVTFEPGSRTHWHSHPVGQTLIVTSGVGLVCQDGQQPQAIKPGDVVKIPANTRHWHGASATNAMTHIAVQEAKNGQVVSWMEAVSDTQYHFDEQ